MKETVVPNRNKIFSSLIQAVALSVATKNIGDDCSVGQPVEIAMGIHAGDHAIYPDCRQEFRDIDFEAFKVGNWDSELVSVYTPYLNTDKFGILQDGELACQKLNLNFDEIYKRTNTSYKPIKVEEGYWVSDFKSAASVERVEAFIKLGRPDPVIYGEKIEDGVRIVQWDEVKAHVESVLFEHKKANI
jgi:7-cyano-7-deazaguanine synthase